MFHKSALLNLHIQVCALKKAASQQPFLLFKMHLLIFLTFFLHSHAVYISGLMQLPYKWYVNGWVKRFKICKQYYHAIAFIHSMVSLNDNWILERCIISSYSILLLITQNNNLLKP